MPRTLAYEPPPPDLPSPRRQRTAAPPPSILRTAAHLPSALDNAAIAVDALSPEARVTLPPHEPSTVVDIRSHLLEGHRFAAKHVAANELLLSWGEACHAQARI